MEFHQGQKIKVKFPFYMGTHDGYDACGEFYSDDVWIPGCKERPLPPDDSELVADDVGVMVLTIVDIHKPGRYPERIFYTRKWVDPDGKEFGSGKLNITTTPTFKRRAAGYYYPYIVL